MTQAALFIKRITSYSLRKEMIAVWLLGLCIAAASIVQMRALVIGYLFAIIVIIFSTSSFRITKAIKRTVWLAFMALAFSITFFIKSDSSQGRMLIYKINGNILKDHFPSGTGLNTYPVIYNQYQARYFEKGNYTEKEILLADNIIYAQNDYLQFIVETGIWGVAIVFLFLILLVQVCRRSLSNGLSPVILFFTGQVISLAIAALFRNIFYSQFFLFLFLISLTLVIASLTLKVNRVKKMAIITTLVIFNYILLVNLGRLTHYSSYERYKAAKELNDAGYLLESLGIYDSLYPQLKNDHAFSTGYIELLIQLDEHKKAIPVIKHAMETNSSAKLYMRLGDCYFKLGDYASAEKMYLTAVYMVPNRFIARFELFHFYESTHQTQKARETGKKIMELPIKIPSNQISMIRQTVQKSLQTLRDKPDNRT